MTVEWQSGQLPGLSDDMLQRPDAERAAALGNEHKWKVRRLPELAELVAVHGMRGSLPHLPALHRDCAGFQVQVGPSQATRLRRPQAVIVQLPAASANASAAFLHLGLFQVSFDTRMVSVMSAAYATTFMGRPFASMMGL
jgi:hypothetical protein